MRLINSMHLITRVYNSEGILNHYLLVGFEVVVFNIGVTGAVVDERQSAAVLSIAVNTKRTCVHSNNCNLYNSFLYYNEPTLQKKLTRKMSAIILILQCPCTLVII